MKKTILAFAATVAVTAISAQQYRTTYFMPGSTVRNELNPAMLPARGYISVPVVGTISADISSSLAIDDILYPKDGELVTFLDSSVPAGEFVSKLSDVNRLDANVSMKMFGAGFYSGKSFFSFGASFKNEIQADLPRELFEFLKVGSGVDGTTYNMRDISMAVDSYMEFAFGYAREVIPNLTVGAKLKFLGGVAHAKYYFDELDLSLTDEQWRVKSKGGLEIAGNGLSVGTTVENGEERLDFDDIDFNPKGLSGGGLALDFGAEYDLNGIARFSASVLNLGKMSWAEKNVTAGTAAADYAFAGFDVVEGTDTNEINAEDFDDFFRFSPASSRKIKSKLTSTILLGAEVPLVGEYLSVGALYTYQMHALYNASQLTVSANITPLSWLSGALSYSVNGQHSGGETLGFFFNIHPSWINFFVGSDYMFRKVSKQYVPVSQQNASVYFGLAIPITRKSF